MTEAFNDRLYRLLPSIYRQRDDELGQPLRALLDAVSEQVDAVEHDIAQLYDNWFIETCQEWVVPYIGDLIGYRVPPDSGSASTSGDSRALLRSRLLIPRSEIANTIRYRKRKGTMSVLADLAGDVAEWPGRVVEFDRLVAGTLSLKHTGIKQGTTAHVRRTSLMRRVDSPFELTAHTAELRRPQSRRSTGRYNLPSIGLFVWRLQSTPVTTTPAYCVETAGDECYTFSVLGNDCPLFAKPQTRSARGGETHAAGLPVALRRADLGAAHGKTLEHHYGEGRSFALWLPSETPRLIAMSALEVADLQDWAYRPRSGSVAIDPELGRIAFAAGEAPDDGLLVSYHCGQGMPIGGGEYHRALADWSPSVGIDAIQADADAATKAFYSVGTRGDYRSLHEAVKQWVKDKPLFAVIELSADDVYSEPISISMGTNQSLILRAADRTRPVIRILDRQASRPDYLGIQGAKGSRIILDGLLVAGRGVQVRGDVAEVIVRDTTIVPGWGTDAESRRKVGGEPCLRLVKATARVRIERSILGSISVASGSPVDEPLDVTICDSIVDATDADATAIGNPEGHAAHVMLTVLRTTVVGRVCVNALALAGNCIFLGPLDVERQQTGCLRFSYVPPESRTPARYNCQPDGASGGLSGASRAAALLRLRPVFNSLQYGDPAYCQLAAACADEIASGADDRSEMGVFHDLYQPQRRAHLQARLDEYAPAGCDVGIIYAS